MAIDVAALAAQGASTLVSLMASESWAQVKARLTRFFARRAAAADLAATAEEDPEPSGPDGQGNGQGTLVADGGTHAVEADRALTRAQRELALATAATDEQAAADVEAEWRGRLRRLLREDPQAAGELRELLAELTREAGLAAGGEEQAAVRNTISGGVQRGPVIQGRDFHGGVRFDNGTT